MLLTVIHVLKRPTKRERLKWELTFHVPHQGGLTSTGWMWPSSLEYIPRRFQRSARAWLSGRDHWAWHWNTWAAVPARPMPCSSYPTPYCLQVRSFYPSSPHHRLFQAEAKWMFVKTFEIYKALHCRKGKTLQPDWVAHKLTAKVVESPAWCLSTDSAAWQRKKEIVPEASFLENEGFLPINI